MSITIWRKNIIMPDEISFPTIQRMRMTAQRERRMRKSFLQVESQKLICSQCQLINQMNIQIVLIKLTIENSQLEMKNNNFSYSFQNKQKHEKMTHYFQSVCIKLANQKIKGKENTQGIEEVTFHVEKFLLIQHFESFLYNFFNFHTMLNPANLFAPKNQTYAPPTRTSTSIVIDRLRDDKKSRWDEPLTIPAVLYAKFKVPVPETLENRQTKQYSHSLVDYIKRAYERCKDDSQRKLMEIQLRKIISSKKMQEVDWNNYPLPSMVTEVKQKHQEQPQVNIMKKSTTKFPPGYNIGDQPSKAKIMAQKRLQKLQEKLKKQEKEQLQEKEQSVMFIGFKSEPTKKPEKPKYIIPLDVPSPPPKMEQKKVQQKQKEKKQKQIERENEKKTPKGKKINKKDLTIIEKAKKEEEEEKNLITKRYVEFNKLKANNQKILAMENDAAFNDILGEKIVGKSKSIEKPYLRITGRPDLDTIRPQATLRKALKYFLQQYKKGKSYEYLIDQFRSIRQDLTVQHIKNSLTVQVYQENLKLSLFEGDSAQFKHCQTTLWQLYRQGIIHTYESRNKFISYQMITLIMEEKYEDVDFMLVQMPEGCFQTNEIQECFKLKRLLLMGNYRGFFDFYATRDEVCRCLINQYIDKIRVKCLLMVCKTFGQKVSLPLLASTIGEDEDLLEAMILKEGGTIENGMFLLKPSYEKLIKSEHLASKKVSILFN